MLFARCHVTFVDAAIYFRQARLLRLTKMAFARVAADAAIFRQRLPELLGKMIRMLLLMPALPRHAMPAREALPRFSRVRICA